MAPKVKEDEKLERTIRGLLKLPENRRCINCNSLQKAGLWFPKGIWCHCTGPPLSTSTVPSSGVGNGSIGLQSSPANQILFPDSGPQYVCTTFCTFICTNCSGIHREFTHRVKSISMAKFTPEEVTALQAGGNERARQIYLKDWDPERHSHPDSSNLYKLRDFIKHVYVDRKFSGERSREKLPRLRLTDKEESYGSRSSNSCRSASGSPRHEDRYERPYGGRSSPSGRSDDGILKYYYDERRSPRYAREVSRYGGCRRSPVRFEVVDDRFRDDMVGSGRRSQGQRLANEESRLGSRSPENQRNMDKSTSTVTRPAKEIVRDDGSSLRVGETLENSDGSANVKKVRSSDNLRNTDGSAAERKEAKSQSLIKCSTDEKPPDASAETHRQTSSSTNGGNWASFAPSAKEKAPSASSANTLEMLLLELTPAMVTVDDVPEGLGGFDGQPTAAVSNTSPTGVASNVPAEQTLATADVPTQQASALADAPSPSTPIASTEHIGEEAPRVAPESCVDLLEHSPSTQQCRPPASLSKDESAAVEKNEPPPLTSLEINEQGPSSDSSQTGAATVQEASPGLASQNLPIEPKPSGRKELPANLFTALYPPAPAPIQGWQTTRPHGIGFNMQYYPNMTPMPTYPSSARSTNPFDCGGGTDQPQRPAFPSMEPLQGAAYNVSASSGLAHTSGQVAQAPGMMPHQSPSYCSNAVLPFQSSSYGSLSMGLHPEQQGQGDMPPSRAYGFGGYGTDSSSFSSLNTSQQMTTSYSTPAAPNSFPASGGGNPFA